MGVNLKNAAPKRYRTKFIEPGLADYTAEGFGKVLVSKEALDQMLPSFVGKYVKVQHNDMSQEEAFDFVEGKESADGVVSEVGYDEESGWYWADLVIWSAEAQDNIDNKGWTVSCAYEVDEADGKGGSYHAIPYDQEVMTGEYTHMAIVDNPRYEGATIVQNSKNDEDDVKGGIMKFKLLAKKKVKNEEPDKKPEEKEEEVQNMEPDAMVEMENGEKVPVSEMVEAYKNRQNMEPDGEKMLNMEDEVDVDGEMVKVSDLVSCYQKRENAEPPTDEKAEEVVSVNNSAPVKKEAKNEHFKNVQNAANIDAAPVKPQINTKSERLARGKERYSKKGGK